MVKSTDSKLTFSLTQASRGKALMPSLQYPSEVGLRTLSCLFLNLILSAAANDVDLSFRLSTTEQPNGSALHARDFDSYFSTVERLYDLGARAFVFNGIMPFDRAQHGIQLGPELQATLAVCLSFEHSLLKSPR